MSLRAFIGRSCRQLVSRAGLTQATNAEIEFILREIQRLNRERRWELMASGQQSLADADQTKDSFDYQWDKFNTGTGLADDTQFIRQVQDQLIEMTDIDQGWFTGKRVADIGCGAGRFTYGLLNLGAHVLACDQSSAGLRQVERLCSEFSDRLETQQVDLLQWDDDGGMDLAFSFGVVHHTGNTYLAIRNVCRKVAPGGKLFLMVYGFPENAADFDELNAYERLRAEVAGFDFQQRKEYLIDKFSPQLAHGWFDAVSPPINDLLTFHEIVQLLKVFGFNNIRRTMTCRNLHVAADKVAKGES